MPGLIWGPSALRDVQRLYRCLAENNADAAKRAVKAIRDSVKIIAHQPGVGRPAEDMELEYREWLIDFGDSGYIALYHYDGQTAIILAVRHQRGSGVLSGAFNQPLIRRFAPPPREKRNQQGKLHSIPSFSSL